MPPFDSLLILTGGALTALALIATASAWAWARWLAHKRHELTHGEPAQAPVAGRIEIADLRERVRKLEAIAAGVDL